MSDKTWTVEGHTFRTLHDYNAACRDKKKVAQLRQSINFQNGQTVLKLHRALEKGSIQFETIIGQDFREEVDEAVWNLNNKGKKRNSKTKPIKQQQQTKQQKKQQQQNKQPQTSANVLDAYDADMKNEIIRELKKRELLRRIGLSALAMIAAVSLGYFVYYYYVTDKSAGSFEELSELKDDNRMASVQESAPVEEKVQKPILDKYKTLYNKNKKLIGWVKIDDTDIDYPVMQSSNEEYYLDHNYDQEKDRNGSIFMDAGCDAMEPSTNLIIYGHNMRSGKMFGSLSEYAEEEYYKKHKRIQFDTIYEEGTYEVMFAFRSRLYEETEIVFKYYKFIDADSDEEFDSNMREMAAMSLYDTGLTAQFGDKLLTLSTCDNNEKNGRFVVVAKKVK